MNNIKETLGKTFKGALLDDPGTLAKYENDTSIFEVTPALVARPNDVDDIKNLVSFVAKEHANDPTLSITPRAAGTGMAGGALTQSIVLDVGDLNTIKEVTDDHAIVEPGVFYRDLDTATLAKNRIMPSYPASKMLCAVGGMVGTNASGEKTLTYGSTVDWVRRLKVVLADGNEYEFGPLTKDELGKKMELQNFEGDIYRKMYDLLETHYDAIKQAKPKVSKNATGYALWNVWDRKTFDLTKLFTGSEGTLGITTEITFGLTKPRAYRKLVVVFIRDLTILPRLVNTVLKYKPEALETYDDRVIQFMFRYIPDFLRAMKTGVLKLGLSFIPEMLMVMRGGFPKLVLLAEFSGETEEQALASANEAYKDLKQYGLQMEVMQTAKDAERFWTMRHESFNVLRKHSGKKKTAPFIDDIVVPPAKLPEFLPRLEKVMTEYKLTYTIQGHIGDGNFHIFPLLDLHKKEERAIVMELGKKVFDLVFEFGGSMSGEHNDGLIRTPFLKQMYGEQIYHLFEKTKDIFDQNHIFNPYKKVYGHDMQYLEDHIDKVY